LNIYNLSQQIWDTPSIYGAAFNAELTAIWMTTPFRTEIEDMSYARAISCFMQDSEDSEDARRKLLWVYLSTFCKHDSQSDPLNIKRPILPSHNRNFQRAINNICTLYNQAPTRNYENLSDGQTKELNSLLKDMKINRHLKHAYKLAKCVNEVLVRPYLIKGKWNIEILTPDLYRIEKDIYTNEITRIWIPFSIRDRFGIFQNKFYVWDNLTLKVADGEGAYQSFSYNGQIYPSTGLIHGYGTVPYVRLMMSENPDVIGGSLWELAKSQLDYNSNKYIAQENVHFAALGLWFFKNIGKANDILLNPGRAFVKNDINPDDQPEIQFIAGSPIYNDVQNYNELSIKDTMQSFGLPNSMLNDTANLQSGVAMKIDRLELNEQRNDDIDIMQGFEEILINHIALISNVETNTSFPTKFGVNTDYIEPSVFLEPKDELDYVQSLYEKGLISPMQYIQRLTGNTNIKTDNDAIKYIQYNLDMKGKINGSPESGGTSNVGTTPTEQQGTGIQSNSITNTSPEQGTPSTRQSQPIGANSN